MGSGVSSTGCTFLFPHFPNLMCHWLSSLGLFITVCGAGYTFQSPQTQEGIIASIYIGFTFFKLFLTVTKDNLFLQYRPRFFCTILPQEVNLIKFSSHRSAEHTGPSVTFKTHCTTTYSWESSLKLLNANILTTKCEHLQYGKWLLNPLDFLL